MCISAAGGLDGRSPGSSGDFDVNKEDLSSHQAVMLDALIYSSFALGSIVSNHIRSLLAVREYF